MLLFPGTLLAQTPGTVTISVTALSGDRDPLTPGLQVDEGDGLRYHVTAHGLTAGSLIIRVVGSGTASVVAGVDFIQNLSSTNNIGIIPTPSVLGQGFDVRVRNDTEAEGDETLIISVRSITPLNATPSTWTAGPPAATVTIRANDGASQAAIAGTDTSVAEGAALNIPLTFTGTPRTAASTVAFAITGTATAADYSVDAAAAAITFNPTAATGSVVVPHTATAATIPITIAADSASDAGETLIVTLTDHTGGGAGVTGFYSTAARTYTIAEVGVFSVAVDETARNEGQTAVFTISLAGAVAGTATVDWNISGVDAGDYTVSGGDTDGTLSFAAVGMQTVSVAINDDNLNEDAETLTFTLSNAANANIGTAAAVTTIAASDDVNATVSGGGTVREGGNAVVTVNLGATATTAVTVGYTITAGTAVAADYSDTSGGSITIAAGSDSGTVTIGITDDDDIEPAEMFTVTIAASDITGHIGTATGGGTQTFTIAASDAVGIAVAVDNATPTEGDTVTFTITLSGGAAATVDWNITGDADDYNGAASGSLSFTAAGSRTVAVTITDDDIIEDAETLTFTLSNATGADITTAAATVTITDNDALTVTISGPSNLNLNTTATYTVDLGGRVLSATTVTITGVDDITIPIGERSGEFTVTAGSAERTLVLTATANGVTGMLTVTITADDSAARAERATVPVASVAQSVGQLASSAIGKRLTFSGGSDFINQNSFALSTVGGGVNFWGSGGTLSANGEINGTTYDADTTAWHIGADTKWNNGLIGIALARTDSETDFTAAGITGKLETDITSVHPYAIRNWNDAKVWGTVGYGSGDAELTETDVFKSDLTILSLAAGVTVNAGRNLTFTTDAHWNRAELSGGNANGKVLPKVTADTTRINIAAQIAANFTNELRPFATLTIRHDIGDGDTGGAADYGGGMEWNTRHLQARLEARSQAQGSGADEDHLSFTLRRTSGTGIAPYAQWNLNNATAGAKLERERFSLGMEVGVTDNALQFKNLLSGEIRF